MEPDNATYSPVRIPHPSEYLDFIEVADTGKTKVWQVLSKRHGDVLALISWHGPWRQYTFRPHPNTIWNTGCLTDVQSFIRRQMEARR